MVQGFQYVDDMQINVTSEDDINCRNKNRVVLGLYYE